MAATARCEQSGCTLCTWHAQPVLLRRWSWPLGTPLGHPGFGFSRCLRPAQYKRQQAGRQAEHGEVIQAKYAICIEYDCSALQSSIVTSILRFQAANLRRRNVRDLPSLNHLNNATAHEGSVTAVLPTPDGLHWVTAGTDSRVRLWDSLTFRYNCSSDAYL